MKNLEDKTLGIIHAALISSGSVKPYIDEILPEVTVVHHVDDTIQNLNFISEPGYVPKQNFFKFASYCHYLENAGVDLIMLACSTFNKAVEHARPMINVPLLQIDRPMMDLALNYGNRIGLIATVPTTVPSSENLLKQAASDAGKEVTIQTVLCSEAFEEIKKGNAEKHNEILITEVNKLSEQVDAIVLAQVSMSVLEPMLQNTKVPVFNSGRTGFNKAREILESL
jgi:aspartate/glutamate racemase